MGEESNSFSLRNWSCTSPNTEILINFGAGETVICRPSHVFLICFFSVYLLESVKTSDSISGFYF